MNRLLFLGIYIMACIVATAQDEQLTGLKFNPALYYSANKNLTNPDHHKYLIDKGTVVVKTDTLKLPFIDDFSTNRTRSYKWVENHITNTYTNVYGGCLANEGITLIEGTFMIDTAWSYTYDTTTHTIDSVPLPSIPFTYFGPATGDCFTNTPITVYYWPSYFTYKFDSSGAVLDSALVDDSTNANRTINTLLYAPVVYFAQGESGTLWFDNYAYINNTYPVNPPTIGVATLDGLNDYGLPYDNSSTSAYGTADYLTSNPIDLSGLHESDSIYLSFFFEAQGLGDYPDKTDSLIVEFKDNESNWNIVWYDTGYADPFYLPDTFQQVMIAMPSLNVPLSYFHNTFQFRFRNKASLYGNNNHWHIDYVKLDKNRSFSDTVIHDMAFVYPFPTILKNYTLMPAYQFTSPQDLRDTITLTIHNLDPNAFTNPPATNFVKEANEVYPVQSIVATTSLETFNAVQYNFQQLYPSSEYTVANTAVDSLVINSRTYINPNDSRALNDTLYHLQSFDKIMAYDDGSAEKAYGLTGLGIKKFGYEFILNKPDTLVGFQVMFTQVESNVSDLIFNFEAWDTLRFNDISFIDTPFWSMVNQKPLYVDSVNGFATFKLDSPLILSGKFYFGWAQSDQRRLQIGYDLNSTLGRQHMYIYTNGTWKPSNLSPDGSPMIRLVFDTTFVGYPTAIKHIQDDNLALSVYPNPTNGIIYLTGNTGNTLDVSISNDLGQTVKWVQGVSTQLDISELPAGIYIMNARDRQNGKTYRSKIIKSSN